MDKAEFHGLLQRFGVHNLDWRENVCLHVVKMRAKSFFHGALVGAIAALFVVWVVQAP